MKIKMKIINKFCAYLGACCFLTGIAGAANLFAQTSYEIVPGVNVGAITANVSEADLKSIYGDENVHNAEVSLGEGETEPGTAIYPDDPNKKIEIIWKDREKKKFPKSIYLNGEKSLWKTKEGISLGTRLKDLEQINGKPFILTGFEWDYSGTVTSWKGGKLAKAFENDEGTVSLRLDNGNKVPDKDFQIVSGDAEFPSNNKIMQRINPAVYQIIVTFPSADARAIKLSSVYTNLKTECKNAFASVDEGQDMPFVCKGYGGYKIKIDFAVFASIITIENSKTSINLPMQSVAFNAGKLEWRMANGKPFAVILRVKKYKENDNSGDDPFSGDKEIGEVLIVLGLDGYSQIDFEVDAKTPDANIMARELADSNRIKQ